MRYSTQGGLQVTTLMEVCLSCLPIPHDVPAVAEAMW